MAESHGVGMSSCCLSGSVHHGMYDNEELRLWEDSIVDSRTGEPVGHIETIGGLQTYVSEPEDKSKSKTIIFIVDSKR